MHKRILIFSPFFSPCNYPEAIVTGKLVLSMIERGWVVDVVTSPASAETNDSCSNWKALEKCVHTTRLETGSLRKVAGRVLGVLEFRHPVIGLGWARQALHIGRKLIRDHRYDAMMSRTRPVYANLPAMVLRRETGIPWIASWNDPPNRDPIPYGPGPGGKISFWENRAVERAAVLADCNLFCSERLRTYSAALYPKITERSEVIPHLGFAASAPLPYPGLFTLVHIGTLDRTRDPRAFFSGLDAFLNKRTPEERSQILVRFVGAHRIDLDLQKLATPCVNEAIRTEPWCAYDESLRRIESATVLLMIEAPMSEGVMLLAKLADYALSKRPILAVSPRVGTAADILCEYGGGIAADNLDPIAVAAALESLFASWKLGRLESDFPKSQISHHFSGEAIVSDFETLIERIQSEAAESVRSSQPSALSAAE